jgi:hypothetical protein
MTTLAKQSARTLLREGVEFHSRKYGTHLVMSKGDQTIDYWPNFDRWWIRGTSNKRTGLQRLIVYLKTKKRT